MSARAADHRVPPSLLGMTLFVSSEVMFFGGLFAAYFMLRGAAGEWPPPGSVETSLLLPVLSTMCLLASSLTVHARRLGATIGLGALFLAGQAFEYRQLSGEGLAASSDVFSTLFFTITGFHGLHVAIGLVMLVTVALRRGRYGETAHGRIEAVSYYWHFVDVVWVLVFLTLYVLR